MTPAPSNGRVLITRSEPGAHATAALLRELGLEPIVEPLFELEPLLPVLMDFDALAFTSANGVREFARLSERRDVPVYCVGNRTAEQAVEVGFAEVASADGDVSALFHLLTSTLRKTTRLLHTGNADSLGGLSVSLRANGFHAAFQATYHARPAASPPPRLAAHLGGDVQFDAVLIHSPRAALTLAEFAESAPDRAALNIAAISDQSVLKISPLSNVVKVAEAPSEPALLEALKLVLAQV